MQMRKINDVYFPERGEIDKAQFILDRLGLVLKTCKISTASQSKRFMHAPLTSKFLLQPLSAECGGLETGHKDSRQMFQHSDRMFEQIFQISFKISFGT